MPMENEGLNITRKEDKLTRINSEKVNSSHKPLLCWQASYI